MGAFRCLYVILALCVLSGRGFGQATSDSTPVKPKKGLLGFHVGVTNTNLSGSQIDLSLYQPGSYQESQPGIDIGMDYKHEFVPFLYLKSGIGLTTKNSYMLESSFVYPLKAELKFVSIPLLFGLQTSSTGRVVLGFESGLMANLDAGSTTGNDAGLHPDNTVVKESFVPSFVWGFNLEVKVNTQVRVFANYRAVNDLDDYYKRTYRLYAGTPDGAFTDYHYNFRVSSSQLTVGLLVGLGRN